MRHVTALVLHAFLLQAHAQEPKATLTDKAPGNLVLPKSGFHVAPYSSSVFLPTAGAVRAARRKVAAQSESVKKALGIRDKATVGEKAEQLQGEASKKVGFRYDKGFNRWVRDDTGGFSINEFANITKADGTVYTPWPKCYLTLVDKGLKSITGEEALNMINSGATLVDVDMEGKHEKRPMKASVNVPLFRPVQGNKPLDIVRKLSFIAFNMVSSESNPDFDKQALERIPKDKPVIVACSRGGSMQDTVKKRTVKKVDNKWEASQTDFFDKERAFGIEARSLRGCYEFYRLGYEDVYHLKGGVNQWCADGLPMDYDLATERADVPGSTAAALIAMFAGCGFLFAVFRCRRVRDPAVGQESLLGAHVEEGAHA